MRIVALLIFAILHISAPISGYSSEIENACCNSDAAKSKPEKNCCDHCPKAGLCCSVKIFSPIALDAEQNIPLASYSYLAQSVETTPRLDPFDYPLEKPPCA